MIDYLNLKAGCSYGYENKTSNKYIADIFKDEYTLDDVKAVIDKKVSEWKGTDYEKYLRPYTLFKPDNFEQYVNSIDTKVLETSFKDEYVLEDYDVNW